MTDADLNALFAVEVAGWVPYEAPKNKGSLLLPYTHFDGAGVPQVGIAPFTASMDAVLPHLVGREFVIRSLPGGFAVDIIDAAAGMKWGYADKSLPRACVLALLRAQGVAV